MAKHDGTGGLWRNKFKVPGDSKPDYIGEITIAGVTHKIAGWPNTSGNPKQPILNLVVSQPQSIRGTKATAIAVDDAWESEIPF